MISALPLWIICGLFAYFALAALKWWWQTPANDLRTNLRLTVALLCAILAVGTGWVAWTGGKP